MPLLSVDGLSISFGGLKALDDVSFAVEKGTIFAIIGPNGAGKTTLFNCVNGIYHADSGEISFKGKKIQKKKAGSHRPPGNRANLSEY